MKRPGKTIEIKDDMKELLARLGFERKGHEGGELVYEKRYHGATLTLYARYADAEGDEWVNEFRVEMRADLGETLDLITYLAPGGGGAFDVVSERSVRAHLARLAREVNVLYPAGRRRCRPTAGEQAAGGAAPGLYNDLLDPDDQITLEETIAGMAFDATRGGRLSEESAARLGRDVLLAVLSRARPDLVEHDSAEATDSYLRVSEPGARTAIVTLKFQGAIEDDDRLARNVAHALAAECDSGNGLTDECAGAEGGYTQTITVTVNRAQTTRDLRP